MRFVAFLALVAVAVSSAEEHTLPPDYSADDPGSWASVAHQKVDAKFHTASRARKDTAARKALESASDLLAKAEYARAADQVQDRDSIKTLLQLEHHALVEKARGERIRKLTQRLDAQLSGIQQKLRPATPTLGEPRYVSQGERAIRAAEMKGSAERWRREGDQWASGADEVKKALESSSTAAARAKLQAEKDAVVASRQRAADQQQQLDKQYDSKNQVIQDRQQQQLGKQQQRLTAKLSKMHQKLVISERRFAAQQAAVDSIKTPLRSVQKLAVEAREQIATQLSDEELEQHEASQLASEVSIRQQNVWPTTEVDDTAQESQSPAIAVAVAQTETLDQQRSKEPMVMQSELREAKVVIADEGSAEGTQEQVDKKLQQEEIVAATLVTDINNQEPSKPGTKAELGESVSDASPRTDVLALARTKRALVREQHQEAVVTHQMKIHQDMKLTALEANSKIVVNGEATKQTNRIGEVEASIVQKEALMQKEQYFVDQELVPKVEALRQTAKAASEGEEHTVELSSHEADAMKRLNLKSAGIEASVIKNQEYEFLHE